MKKKGFLSVLLAAAMVSSMVAAVPAAAEEGGDETLTVWCWDRISIFMQCSRLRKSIRQIIRTSSWTFRRMFTVTLRPS